jgi:glycosyltransferase involved in cell wall biosynthesis
METSTSHSLSAIITTYNQPKYLELVLWGYVHQSNKNFEVVIADDGSGDETFNVIDWFKNNTTLNIKHVWHPDNGFQKCTILNKAILESTYDYLLFTDGDCIPRTDFVDVHLKRAKKGHFLSGGYFKLSRTVSEKISKSDIERQYPFNAKWLVNNGQPYTYKMMKMVKNKNVANLLNAVTSTKPTWNGHNVSGWKSDIIEVNGYNEDMMYGGLDRELGERLENAGISGLQIRYSAIVVHLDHPRPYKKKELVEKNRAIRKNVRDNKVTFTANGIKNHLQNGEVHNNTSKPT